MQETLSWGGDGWALDAGSVTDPAYLFRIDCIYKAAAAVTAQIAAGTTPNPAGVKQFVLVLTPDFAAVPEDPATLTALATLFLKYAHDPATLTHPDPVTHALRPVLSTYAGDGANPGQTAAQTVAQIYNPMLAQIRAGAQGYPGVNVFFVPGWEGVDELNAVGADGGWLFPPGTTPLGAASALPSIEAAGLAVQGAKNAAGQPLLFMQPIFAGGYHDNAGGNLHYYNEYAGAKALSVQMMSAISTVKPLWLEIIGQNDYNEGSLITSLLAQNLWPGMLNYGVPDYWQTQDGLLYVLRYYVQWYKTGVQPVITEDTLCLFNRTQTAAASAAPATGTGIGYVTGVSGEPAGLQDRVDVTALLTRAGFVRVTCGSYSQSQFAPAGVSHLSFLGVPAGTPRAEFIVQNQVAKQVIGHPITASAQILNMNTASRVSAPGVSFSVTVPLPASFPVDRAAVFVRSTRTANAAGAIGVCNLSVLNTGVSPAVPVAGNTLNNPAGLGSLLDHSTAAGQDALAQYNGNGYAALYQDPLGLYPTPLAYNTIGNTNVLYFLPGKPLPAASYQASVRIVSTSSDLNADGQGGVALVNSQAPNGHYQGQAQIGYVQKYAGGWTFTIKAEDNVGSDATSAGPTVLASLPVNSLAPGEWYDVSVAVNTAAGTATWTARPSNQQLP